jgi:hypothetical protein
MYAILGGFLVVVSPLFSPSVVGWVVVGVGIGIVVITALVQLETGRGCARRVLDDAPVVVSPLLIGFGIAASGRAVPRLLNEVANRRLSVGLGNLRRVPCSPLQEPAMQHARAA